MSWRPSVNICFCLGVQSQGFQAGEKMPGIERKGETMEMQNNKQTNQGTTTEKDISMLFGL